MRQARDADVPVAPVAARTGPSKSVPQRQPADDGAGNPFESPGNPFGGDGWTRPGHAVSCPDLGSCESGVVTPPPPVLIGEVSVPDVEVRGSWRDGIASTTLGTSFPRAGSTLGAFPFAGGAAPEMYSKALGLRRRMWQRALQRILKLSRNRRVQFVWGLLQIALVAFDIATDWQVMITLFANDHAMFGTLSLMFIIGR